MRVNLADKEITFEAEELQKIVKWGKYIDEEFGGIPEESEQELLDQLIENMIGAGIEIPETD